MTLKRVKVYKKGNNRMYSTTVKYYLIWPVSVFSPSTDMLRGCCSSNVKIVIQDDATRRETFLGTAANRLSGNYISDNKPRCYLPYFMSSLQELHVTIIIQRRKLRRRAVVPSLGDFPPRGHLAMSRDTFDCQNGEGGRCHRHLVGRGEGCC